MCFYYCYCYCDCHGIRVKQRSFFGSTTQNKKRKPRRGFNSASMSQKNSKKKTSWSWTWTILWILQQNPWFYVVQDPLSTPLPNCSPMPIGFEELVFTYFQYGQHQFLHSHCNLNALTIVSDWGCNSYYYLSFAAIFSCILD